MISPEKKLVTSKNLVTVHLLNFTHHSKSFILLFKYLFFLNSILKTEN